MFQVNRRTVRLTLSCVGIEITILFCLVLSLSHLDDNSAVHSDPCANRTDGIHAKRYFELSNGMYGN